MPQGEDELAKRLVMLDEVAPTDPWLSEAVGQQRTNKQTKQGITQLQDSQKQVGPLAPNKIRRGATTADIRTSLKGRHGCF